MTKYHNPKTGKTANSRKEALAVEKPKTTPKPKAKAKKEAE